MKKLLIVLATLALIAGMAITEAKADTTATISVTVTLQNISVTLSSSTWSIGTIVAGSQTAPATYTATNNGNVTEDLKINCGGGTGGAIPWTASADTTAGINEFVMEVQSTDTGSAFVLLGGGTDVLFGNDIIAAGSRVFDLRFTAPTTSSDYATHTITVTVTAAAVV